MATELNTMTLSTIDLGNISEPSDSVSSYAVRSAVPDCVYSPDARAFIVAHSLECELSDLKEITTRHFDNVQKMFVTLSTETDVSPPLSKLVLEVDTDMPRRQFNAAVVSVFRTLVDSRLYELLTVIRA